MDKEKMSSLDDAHLQPKYRQYVSAIDKVLKSFESSSEWADLISALGKLNKVTLKINHLINKLEFNLSCFLFGH